MSIEKTASSSDSKIEAELKASYSGAVSVGAEMGMSLSKSESKKKSSIRVDLFAFGHSTLKPFKITNLTQAKESFDDFSQGLIGSRVGAVLVPYSRLQEYVANLGIY